MLSKYQQLEICKQCENRKFDISVGIYCSLTGNKPDFLNSCSNFIKDETVIIKEADDEYLLLDKDLKNKLPEHLYNDLVLSQNLSAAIIFGTIASVLSAILWTVFTLVTGFQLGIMALAVGAIVGFTVRFTGKGISKKFGVIGALLSLIGCLLGNILSLTQLVAVYNNLNFWDLLFSLNLKTMFLMLVDWFDPVDIVFYSIAVYEGFRFSLVQITEKKMKELLNRNS